MLLTAISDAVERYDTEREAVVMIETEKGFEVTIVTATGSEPYPPTARSPLSVISNVAGLIGSRVRRPV